MASDLGITRVWSHLKVLKAASPKSLLCGLSSGMGDGNSVATQAILPRNAEKNLFLGAARPTSLLAIQSTVACVVRGCCSTARRAPRACASSA